MNFLVFVAIALLLASCTTPEGFVDSARMGNKVDRVELKRCEPTTEKGPIIISGRMPAGNKNYRNAYRGEAVAKYEVSQTGIVDSVEIMRSSNEGFSEAIIKAVSNWRFEPAVQEGKATPVVCTQLFRYNV